MADSESPRHPSGARDEDPFDPGPVPEELALLAAEKEWPPDLLPRMWSTRRTRGAIEWSLTGEDTPPVDVLIRETADRERLQRGTLRRRIALESDNDAVADLFANSPEEIDGWEITVERSPDAFAQYRLQDRVEIRFVEDRGVGMALSIVGGRNCVVAGRPTHVAFVQSYRVRRGFRGAGFSRLVTGFDFPAATPYYDGQVGYMRARNTAAVAWAQAAAPHAIEGNRMEGDIPGTEVVVDQIPAVVCPPSAEVTVRPATPDDLPRCVELINRVHDGIDLVRPYSEEWFDERLKSWSWSPKPEWIRPVYGWDDFFVAERGGQVVACGGLWDRGANVRERWRHLESGQERTIDTCALLDEGWADGEEASMAALIEWMVTRTSELGRGYLLASIMWFPRLRRLVDHLGPVPERRGLIWRGFVPCERPYVDLTFW